MIIQKNKKYDPTDGMVICHFEWEVEINKETAPKVIKPEATGRPGWAWATLRDDVNEWCTNQFGPAFFLDGTLGSWAAATMPIGQSEKRQIVFYFRGKDDALLFKLAWN